MELNDMGRMEKIRNVHAVIAWRNKGQRLLDKIRFRLKSNIAMDLLNVNFFQLAMYRFPLARFLNEAVYLRILYYKKRGSVATVGDPCSPLSVKNIWRGGRCKMQERRK
jgi:hypothetical protein